MFSEQLVLIDERSAALRDAVAAASSLGVRVPGCPDWELRDLVVHLGRVQLFWASAVTAAEVSEPPARPAGDVPDDLLEWSAAATRRLIDALRAAGPSSPCWTWWGVPATAGAVARHQVQEAGVHAYDAEETVGSPSPLPAAVAVDGVAEFVTVGLAAQGEWPHRPARLVLSAVDGPSWTVDLTPTGAALDPAAAGDPVATVSGTASDLVLALYGRIPWDGLRVEGDGSVLAELRGWASTG